MDFRYSNMMNAYYNGRHTGAKKTVVYHNDVSDLCLQDRYIVLSI